MIFGKHVNKYYFKYAPWFIVGTVALIIVDYLQLQIPDITGSIIDGLDNSTLTEAVLNNYMFRIMGIAVIMVTGRFLWRYTIFGASRRIDYDLKNRLFQHATRMSQSYYSDQKTGGLMAYFTNDLDAVRMAFGPGFLMLVDAAFLGSLAVYKMIQLDVYLTLMSTIPLLIIALMGGIIGKYMQAKFKARQMAFENLSDFTQENFSGIQVIKAFVKEGKELLAFKKINQENYEKNIAFARAAVLLQVLLGSVITLVIIVILGYGGYLVIASKGVEGGFTIGDLSRFIAYFTALIWPMAAIAQLINMTSQSRASYKRIATLLDHEVEIKDAEDVLPIDRLEGNITFNHFSFKYPNTEKEVLRDIHITIKAGEAVGIIGKTGSGKTTLVDVMLRLYNLNTQSLLLDGHDIMRLPLKTVRSNIAYVPQDNFLYSDKLVNNIAFALDEVNEEQAIAYAKLADVHDNIIEFKEGYHTVIGERGVTLSGGQKQRVSIARALIKDAPILILDDSVSAVDTSTEETILRNLKKIRKGKTTLIIAHRVSTLKTMDKVLLIEEGEVLGFGTHQELLISSPIYQDMVKRQELEKEVEGLS